MRWVFRVVVVVTLLFLSKPVSAQVVINEILLRASDNSRVDQIVELRNSGTSTVNIGGWIFVHLGDYSSIVPSGTSLAPGSFIVFHFNAGGTNTSNEIYFPGKQLDDVSDLALYAANTITNGGFSNHNNIRTFVQWGGVPTNGRQNVAATAGMWTSNTFIPLPAAGHSIELCSGNGISPSGYVAQPVPTVGGGNGCRVGVETVSWGQVKAIFQ